MSAQTAKTNQSSIESDSAYSLELLEKIAAITSMAGALLLALNNEYSKLAYPIWMISNPLYVYFMFRNKHFATAFRDLFFMGTTVVGMATWWF